MTTAFDKRVCLPAVYEDSDQTLDLRVVVSQERDGGVLVLTDEPRSPLVIVENCGGKLICHVWANRWADEPSHSIEVELAPYEERRHP